MSTVDMWCNDATALAGYANLMMMRSAYCYILMHTCSLTVVIKGICYVTHSLFRYRLKPPFSANPSHRSLPFLFQY